MVPLVFFLLATSAAAQIEESPRVSPVEKPLRVGAFNVQNLGNAKLGNETQMKIIKKIILEFDLILIQEIVTKDQQLLGNLLSDINRLSSYGPVFNLSLSERLGRGNAKEQYGYFYRSDRLTLKRSIVFPDKNDKFMRPPYIAHFISPTTLDLPSFLAIGVHTQPKYAANETSSMVEVYDYAAKEFDIEDAIMMGDMNAGCNNVRVSDWNGIRLWKDSRFKWLIGHEVDTTTYITGCPYDRIVLAGERMIKCAAEETADIFKYKTEYKLKTALVRDISDHWPVQVYLRGRVSTATARFIDTKVCMSILDKRPVEGDPSSVVQGRNKAGFTVTVWNSDETEANELRAEQEKTSLPALLLAVADFESRFPGFISRETLATLRYKAEWGSLQDLSVYSEPRARPKYLAQILCGYPPEGRCTVNICKQTQVN